jgi:PEP-CTERM motif
MADASLTLNQTSAECVTDQRVGDVIQRTVAACAPGPAFMVIGNGTRGGPLFSFIQLTYAFAYRDDGLMLPSAVTLATGDYGGATASAFARPPSVSFESATLNVDVSSTFGPNPAGPGYVISASAIDAPIDGISLLDGYLLFGLNDHPDAFSGNITVTVGVTAFGLQDFAAVSGVSVTPSVAAIPEPSTWALLLSGMALLAHFCRGARSDRTHFRWRSVGVF